MCCYKLLWFQFICIYLILNDFGHHSLSSWVTYMFYRETFVHMDIYSSNIYRKSVESFGGTIFNFYFIALCLLLYQLHTVFLFVALDYVLILSSVKSPDFILQYCLGYFNVHLYTRINNCINPIYTCPSCLLLRYNLYEWITLLKKFQLFIDKNI